MIKLSWNLLFQDKNKSAFVHSAHVKPEKCTMGNENSKKSYKALQNKPSLYAKLLESASAGEEVYRCTYEQWLRGVSGVGRFADRADYSCEDSDSDLRCKGLALRPDLTQGRFLRVTRISSIMIKLEEKHCSATYFIQGSYTSGKIPQRLRLDYRTSVVNFVQQQNTKDGISIIGCHGNLAVAQVLDRVSCYVPEFYFLDLATHKCMGKFATKDSELMWYECYISPDNSKIVLRPDINTYDWSPQDAVKTYQVYNITVITMRKFPDSGGHALTFDYRHGNRYMFRAKEKDIQLFDLTRMEVVQDAKNLCLPASIKQLKASPSGLYLAARCVYPSFSMEYQTNAIAIVNCANLEVMFQVDARGSYWPVSEVVNLQVFPQFSACDSSIAFMRHGSSKRKVHIYKMGSVMCSLQHCCRKVIRTYVSFHDIPELQLPKRLQKYLSYD